MSWTVENTIEDIDYLVGGTITAIEIQPNEYEPGTNQLVLKIKLKTPIRNQDDKVMRTVDIQVWQDEEGNGPGYLALVGGS